MRRAFLIGALWLAILSGCGTVGPPIPPEDIGVAAKLEKEKARAKLQTPPPKEPEKEDDQPEDENQQLSLPR
ncbi:MAG: hypothetical protein HY205_06000 [Nitrospirae bacterium]|nr:hypothetical protein [Nitrospirota bacterium]